MSGRKIVLAEGPTKTTYLMCSRTSRMASEWWQNERKKEIARHVGAHL